MKKRPESYDHVWNGDFLVFHSGAYYNIELMHARDEGIGRAHV